jgi:hypothetical protein
LVSIVVNSGDTVPATASGVEPLGDDFDPLAGFADEPPPLHAATVTTATSNAAARFPRRDLTTALPHHPPERSLGPNSWTTAATGANRPPKNARRTNPQPKVPETTLRKLQGDFSCKT